MRYEVRRLVVADATQLRALRLRALATDPSAFGSTLERELAFPSLDAFVTSALVLLPDGGYNSGATGPRRGAS